MEFFRRRTNIDFLGIRKWTAIFSVVMILASIICVGVKGINWGLDFTGGYSVQLHYKAVPNLAAVRKLLSKNNVEHARVINFGSRHDVMLRIAVKTSENKTIQKQQQAKLLQRIENVFGKDASITQVSFIGSSVGKTLAQHGVLALIVALLATMAYIGLRFESRFAISAVIALMHDPILIMGIFALFQLNFDLTVLAALLAVLGYSLNDTVVVYDRIRENFKTMRKVSVVEIVNRAVNDTLSRTIMTSSLTLIVVVVLYLFGGESIHNFSLALIIGIVVGTYSSVYIAGSLAVVLGLNRLSLVPRKKDPLHD